MDDSRKNELLEIYKLHATLADRVSQRRETANQLHAGLLTGFAAVVGALLRFGPGESQPIVLLVCGFVGAALAASWYLVLRSYRQLNAGKFAALHELENSLEYNFFTREWQLLKGGKRARKYSKLTVVETVIPLVFLAISLGLMTLGIIRVI